MKDRKKQEFNNKIELQKVDRAMPDLKLQGYSCELCEDFRQPSSLPYHKALANQGTHNNLKHQTGQVPRIMFLYKI